MPHPCGAPVSDPASWNSERGNRTQRKDAKAQAHKAAGGAPSIARHDWPGAVPSNARCSKEHAGSETGAPMPGSEDLLPASDLFIPTTDDFRPVLDDLFFVSSRFSPVSEDFRPVPEVFLLVTGSRWRKSFLR